MTTSKATLALDLGTTTGWAMRRPDGLVVHGVEEFKPGRFEGGGMRFLRFVRWLDQVGAEGLGQVWFEEVRRHNGTSAAHVYGGLMAHLTAWCEQRSIPYGAIPVGVVKRAWTGKGNAGKEAMKGEAVRRGYTVTDDNEADALAVLFAAEQGAA